MNLKEFIAQKELEYKKAQEQNFLDSFKELLSDDRSLEVFRRLLETAQVFSSCFTGNSTTFYNEGRRDVGLEVLSWIAKADSNYIAKIMQLQGEKNNLEKEIKDNWIKEFDDDN